MPSSTQPISSINLCETFIFGGCPVGCYLIFVAIDIVSYRINTTLYQEIRLIPSNVFENGPSTKFNDRWSL